MAYSITASEDSCYPGTTVLVKLLIRRAGYDVRFADCDMDYLMIATIQAAHGVMDYLYDFFDSEIQPLAI